MHTRATLEADPEARKRAYALVVVLNAQEHLLGRKEGNGEGSEDKEEKKEEEEKKKEEEEEENKQSNEEDKKKSVDTKEVRKEGIFFLLTCSRQSEG